MGVFKAIIKRILPSQVKKAIKKEILASSPPQQTIYVIHEEDTGKLHGKRIIVTGGTGAIGSAICHRLYLEGATVGVCGRNIEKIENIISRFRDENFPKAGILIPVVMDVLDEKNIQIAIDSFVDQTGGLDAIVNNAGGSARQESKPFYEQSVETIDYVLNTNLRGCMICAKYAARVMIPQRTGTIINMSSVVGIQGKSNMSDYAAAKAGIIGFTRSLALELGKFNIRVNSIAPGIVNQTPFDAGTLEKKTALNCLGRKGYTDEVANVIAFLVADESRYITGDNLVVDGGRSLGLYGDK